MIDLYGQVIADHFRHPRNRGALDAADVSHEDANALCGDRVRFELRVVGGQVVAARFAAEACAVATAAASLLTVLVEGLSVDRAAALPEDTLLSALGTTLRPARVGCARLPLDVLRAAVAKHEGNRR